MKTESQIREEGITWDVVQKAFIWYNLSKDFLRQLVEADPVYKTQIDTHIIAALHGFASYPSTFYQNACYYIQNGLTEQKQLLNYVNQLYMMYRQQAEKEYNSRTVYRYVDGATGRVLDHVFY